MAQPGAFVPAWKRLGLKLKKHPESDSNHEAFETQTDHSSAQNGSTSQEDMNLSNDAQHKSRLGKRKHHSDTADIEGESVKKTKHDRESDPTNGHTVTTPEAGLELPEPPPASGEAPADKVRPRGDPNYRKKKGDSNYRKKKEPKDAKIGQKSQQSTTTVTNGQGPPAHLAAPKHARTPSLSPAQTDFVANGSTLLPSTETDLLAPASLATPNRQKAAESSSKYSNSSLSPAKNDRRKSVTFTPDTKKSDGNSASNLFKKWAAEQKGQSAEFSPAEVAQFTEPPKVHVANSDPSSIPKTPKAETTSKGRKKDPSRYLDYLTRYHQDRANWKFNKAIQNDVLDNSLNIFRIPEEYSEALLEYVRGLQGAGVIERLRNRCTKTIAEVDEAESKDPMDEREALKEAALQDRISKEQKRRRLEGDIENVHDHPYTEGYIRRLKRSRAEALCSALRMALPASIPSRIGFDQDAKQTSSKAAQSLAQANVRKRKRRTDVSSDESSDSSSSEEEEESSSEESSAVDSESDADSSDSDSSTDSSNRSGRESASDSDSD